MRRMQLPLTKLPGHLGCASSLHLYDEMNPGCLHQPASCCAQFRRGGDAEQAAGVEYQGAGRPGITIGGAEGVTSRFNRNARRGGQEDRAIAEAVQACTCPRPSSLFSPAASTEFSEYLCTWPASVLGFTPLSYEHMRSTCSSLLHQLYVWAPAKLRENLCLCLSGILHCPQTRQPQPHVPRTSTIHTPAELAWRGGLQASLQGHRPQQEQPPPPDQQPPAAQAAREEDFPAMGPSSSSAAGSAHTARWAAAAGSSGAAP